MVRTCFFKDIASYHNIRMAFLKAIRGKRMSAEVILFYQNIDRNLRAIQTRLSAGNIQWDAYHQFTITDPKRRVISAVSIEDRNLHHAVVNILEPLFEQQMVYHTYVRRKNRGTHGAIQYAFSMVTVHWPDKSVKWTARTSKATAFTLLWEDPRPERGC
jgi:retron-type reverse transcriptase